MEVNGGEGNVQWAYISRGFCTGGRGEGEQWTIAAIQCIHLAFLDFNNKLGLLLRNHRQPYECQQQQP